MADEFKELFGPPSWWFDVEYDLEQALVAIPITHRPGEGYPRPGCHEEAVFANAWERYMEASPVRNLRLYSIVSTQYGLPDQKVATLLATVFTWLATNCGTAMIEEAKGNTGRNPLMKQWADENLRRHYLSSGKGIIDSLRERIGWAKEDLTLDLYRCTFHLMEFLDTEEGRLLLRYVQERRKRWLKVRERRARNHHAFRHGYGRKAQGQGGE